MDVDIYNFQSLLPAILANIKSSRFVAIDLELSGIPRRSQNRQAENVPRSNGKQTLQQRYIENKAAAEQFHILQFGLTCVEECEAEDCYILRPYNFQVSPLVDERLKIERNITYQNGAVHFLMYHQFQMNVPFDRGIPYLSWAEESAARSSARASWTRDEWADIEIHPDDLDNLALMKRIREDIKLWRQTTPQPEYLNISALEESEDTVESKGLNRYQKRLIHQLVRAEYPDLVSISRPETMQIITRDARREEAHMARKAKALELNLSYQTGLRNVVEALCTHGRLPGPPNDVSRTVGSASQELQTTPSSEDLSTSDTVGAVGTFNGKRPMLVGHNLFLDLIYLYASFFGSLPDQVEDFQAILRDLFRTVVDTKYVADEIHADSPSYSSALEDVDRDLSILPSPSLDIPPEFDKYGGKPRLHEAGYDAFLTARALICLSATERRWNPSDHSSDLKVNTQEQIHVNIGSKDVAQHDHQDSANGKVLEYASTSENDRNPFKMLATLDLEGEVDSTATSRSRLMMPIPDDQFWDLYGNKLRVNGTIEGMCEL